MKWTKRTLVTLTLLSSAAVMAQSRQLELDYKGREFTGQSTIHLKQDLKLAYPNIQIDNLELERVVLVAKSKQGNAEARLIVGRFDSRIEQIDGNPRDFRTAGSFNRIPFEAPNRDNGAWQIQMRGNIKVKKVIVNVTRDRPDRDQVTRQCGYVLETIWGQDMRRFNATSRGIQGTGVQARACDAALNECRQFQRRLPLGELRITRCVKL